MNNSAPKITQIPTRGMTRNDWLALRKRGLGGSDMGAVLGVSEWATPVSVWLDKTGRRDDTPANDAMWLGTLLEDGIARRYADENNVAIQKHNYMLLDGEHHLVGNIDRLVAPAGRRASHQGEIRTDKGLECKSTSAAPWDSPPLAYQSQVATYMALAPAIARFDIAAAFIGQAKGFCVYPQERDEDVIAHIRDAAKEFWERYVLADTPPPCTSEDDARAVWARHNPGKSVVASVDVEQAVAQLIMAKEAAAAAQAEASRLQAAVMDAMGDAEELRSIVGKKLVTWKNNKDVVKVDWEAVAKDAGAAQDIIDAHTTVKQGARVFRVA